MKKSIIITLILSLILPVFILSTPKVNAVSTSLVLAQIYLGNSGVSSHEYIAIFNTSSEDVDITNWCLEFASSENYRDIVCFEPPTSSTRLFIRSGEFVLSVSETFAATITAYDFIFSNNANIPGTNGSIRLVDSEKLTIDTIGWGSGKAEGNPMSSLANGKIFNRITDPLIGYLDTNDNASDFKVVDVPLVLVSGGVYEKELAIDLCINIEGVQTRIPDGFLSGENDECYEDFCPNLDGLQVVAPDGYEKVIGTSNCEEIPKENSTLFITELLPNPPSYDTDAEFIELYNPNTKTVNLAGYKIEVGPSFTKYFEFSDGFIEAGEYLVFNDGITGITLPNSSGVKLRLITPAGKVVSETEIYSNAADDVSWALVDDQWIYTNQITPDGPNKPYLETIVEEVAGVTTVYAPCPAGKYRNPETNRCRTIETAVSQLQPCDEDEYRNPETNRCRKITTATRTLAPCGPGEERNPETNRCRKVSTLAVTSTDDIPTVTDATTTQTSGSINWGIISVALLATVGYMVYEWRSELGRALVKLK